MKRLKQISAIAMAVMMAVVFMPLMPGVNGVAKAEEDEQVVVDPVAQIGTTKYDTVQTAVEAAESSQTVRMIADSEEERTFAQDDNLTLDLNGHILKGIEGKTVITNHGALTVTDSRAYVTHYYTVDNNGQWIWNDSNVTNAKRYEDLNARPKENDVIAVRGGAITGGSGPSGGGIYSDNHLTMEGGNIAGNLATQYGAGIFVCKNATFHMKDGKIIGNYSVWQGAGLFNDYGNVNMSGGSISFNRTYEGRRSIESGGVHGGINMSGGKITYNESDGGAGINACNLPLIMTGGEVSHNISRDKRGGVINKWKVILGGTAKITDNEGGNLYLPGISKGVPINEMIEISSTTKPVTRGENPSGQYMLVGVTKEDGPESGSPVSITDEINSNYISCFISDNDEYCVKYAWGESPHLELAVSTVKIDKDIQNGRIEVDDQSAGAGEEVSVTAIPDDWYEADEITVTDNNGTDITAEVLKDATITMPSDNLPITVSASFKRTVRPPSEPKPYISITGTGGMQIKATIDGDKAGIATISGKEIAKAGETVTIDLSDVEIIGEKKEITQVTLTKETLQNLSELEVKNFEIRLSSGTIVLDKKAVEAITEQVRGTELQLTMETGANAEKTLLQDQKNTISKMNNASVVSVDLKSAGNKISDLEGGVAKVLVGYETNKNVRAWFVKNSGYKEAVSSDYDSEKQVVAFDTGHFSIYAIETVEEKNIIDCELLLSAHEFTFNDSVQKPEVGVRDGSNVLEKDVDYTAEVDDGINVGKHGIEITGITKYTGTLKGEYVINPAPKAINTVKAGKKKLTVKWEKSSKPYRAQTTQFQIKYSTSKNFTKSKNVYAKPGASKRTIKGLKAHKKYYVKMRAVTVVKGERFCSSWSEVKVKKTK